MAEDSRAGAHRQPPVKWEDELAAALALRNPTEGLCFGVILRTHLFGPPAAVLLYNCFSRAVAPLARRILKIPMRWILWRFWYSYPELSGLFGAPSFRETQ